FVEGRLLTIRSDADNPKQTRVELAHEVLIERWQRLAGWLALSQDGRAAKEAFENDAARWDRGMLPRTQRRSPKLLRSTEVAGKHLDWLERTSGLVLTPTQQEFRNALDVQRQEERAATRRRTRNLQYGIVAAILVAILLAGTTGYALWAQYQTNK